MDQNTNIHYIPYPNYLEHPAFVNYRIDPTQCSKELSPIIRKATYTLQRLQSFSKASDLSEDINRIELKSTYKKGLEIYHNDFKNLYNTIVNSRTDWNEFDIKTLKAICQRIGLEYKRLIIYFYKKAKLISRNRALIEKCPYQKVIEAVSELEEQGYKTFRMNPEYKAKLVYAAQKYVDQLAMLDTSGRDSYIDPKMQLEKKLALGFRRSLNCAIGELKLDKIASAYLGIPVKLMSFSISYNRGFDQWWSKRYSDLGIAVPETAYMHYDSNSGMVKALVYLNDISATDGPFSYLPGSHNWSIDLFHKLAGQALPYCGMKLESDQQRILFLKLPEEIRFISHFGDDLIANSDVERQLLQAEKKFTSEDGDVILFDNYGLHRGGTTRGGERIALQLQFSSASVWMTELLGRVVGGKFRSSFVTKRLATSRAGGAM